METPHFKPLAFASLPDEQDISMLYEVRGRRVFFRKVYGCHGETAEPSNLTLDRESWQERRNVRGFEVKDER